MILLLCVISAGATVIWGLDCTGPSKIAHHHVWHLLRDGWQAGLSWNTWTAGTLSLSTSSQGFSLFLYLPLLAEWLNFIPVSTELPKVQSGNFLQLRPRTGTASLLPYCIDSNELESV